MDCSHLETTVAELVTRIGMISFLLLMQAVDPAVVSSVSSAEVSLCSLSELVMLGIAAIASDPSSFGLLVGLSSGTVIAAAVVYSVWVYGQTNGLEDTEHLPKMAAHGLA
jgi:hypothetical protein